VVLDNSTTDTLKETGQTEPGLVGLYDIWPGYGAGLFLQTRSLHGAITLAKPRTVRHLGTSLARLSWKLATSNENISVVL